MLLLIALLGITAALATLGAGTTLQSDATALQSLGYTALTLVIPVLLIPAAAGLSLVDLDPMYLVAIEIGLLGIYNTNTTVH